VVASNFPEKLEGGWSESRRNKINNKEFGGTQTKKEHLYCRVQADTSGLAVVRKLEIVSGIEMDRM